MVESTVMPISVVIPVYNGERHIGKALESVLAQTMPAAQIIVVNDGSKDGTAAVLDRYAGRIEVITIPNGGVSRARNAGLARVTSDWIALLDADDVWVPGKLEAQARMLRAHPGVEFTCCNYLLGAPGVPASFTHFDHLVRHREPFFDKALPSPYALLLEENVVGTCSNVMFSRRLLEQVGPFDVELKQSEDFELWLRMALVTDFVLQSDVLLEKITHETNLTNRFHETLHYHERVLVDFRASHSELFARDAELDQRYQLALKELRYQIADLLARRGDTKACLHYLWAGFRTERPSGVGLARLVRKSLYHLTGF